MLDASVTRHNVAVQLGRSSYMGEERDRLRGRINSRLADVWPRSVAGLCFGSYELPEARDREPLVVVEQAGEPDGDLPPAAA